MSAERDDIDGAGRPADAGAHHQSLFLRQIFQHLCEAGLQTFGAEFRGTLQYLAKVPRLHRDAAEFAKQRLLSQPVGELVANRWGRGGWG